MTRHTHTRTRKRYLQRLLMNLDSLTIGPNSLKVEALSADRSAWHLLMMLLRLLSRCVRRRGTVLSLRLLILSSRSRYLLSIRLLGLALPFDLRILRAPITGSIGLPSLLRHPLHPHRRPLRLTLCHCLAKQVLLIRPHMLWKAWYASLKHRLLHMRLMRHPHEGLNVRYATPLGLLKLVHHELMLLLHLQLPCEVLLVDVVGMVMEAYLRFILLRLSLVHTWRQSSLCLPSLHTLTCSTRRAHHPSVRHRPIVTRPVAFNEQMYDVLRLAGISPRVQCVRKRLVVVDESSSAVE